MVRVYCLTFGNYIKKFKKILIKKDETQTMIDVWRMLILVEKTNEQKREHLLNYLFIEIINSIVSLLHN